MRTLGKRQLEEETEIDITPMLDVVFIMLIFFIVTATFVKEAGTDVNKPEAKTATQKKQANILIAIDANDTVWIDGGPVEVNAIGLNVKTLRSENPKGSVVIQADEESTHEMLLEVLKAANTVGVSDVAISTSTN